MVNYANGKIYKIVNNIDDKFYIGSTCQPLYRRKGNHKKESKKHPNRKVYQHLNKIGWENVKIILIEKWPCDSKEELERRERYFIEKYKTSLNCVVPTQNRQEFYIKNKDRINNERKAKYHKNPERIKRQSNEYYHKNKASINSEKRKVKVDCECGSNVRKSDIARHRKSKKHLNFIKCKYPLE